MHKARQTTSNTLLSLPILFSFRSLCVVRGQVFESTFLDLVYGFECYSLCCGRGGPRTYLLLNQFSPAVSDSNPSGRKSIKYRNMSNQMNTFHLHQPNSTCISDELGASGSSTRSRLRNTHVRWLLTCSFNHFPSICVSDGNGASLIGPSSRRTTTR